MVENCLIRLCGQLYTCIRKEQVGQEIAYAHVHAFDQNKIKSAYGFHDVYARYSIGI